MTYLIDTNVLSEVRKPAHRAEQSVRRWVAERHLSELHLSAITILEIEVGILRLERRDTQQATLLRSWLEGTILPAFSGRVIPVDVAVARRAAALHVLDPRPERDAYIAATALDRGLIVATRNVSDFAPMSVPAVNPWER